MARVKYINLDSVKFVIFTKLESSMSQRQTKVTHKTESRMNDNLVLLKISKCLFPTSTIESLCTTKIAW